MDQLPKSVTKYLEAICSFSIIEDYEERLKAINDNTEILRTGATALLDEMGRGHVPVDETFGVLNASKSLASTHELLRHEAKMAGYGTIAYIDAIAKPVQVADFLNNRPHSTAIVTLHLLSDYQLAVFIARNGGPRKGSEGIVGTGNILYSFNYANGLKNEVRKLLDSNMDRVLSGKFSFEAAKPLLECIGSFILSLLLFNPDAPTEVIFIPDRALHFLPLHALPVGNDDYLHNYVRIISYASSISELLFAGLLLRKPKVSKFTWPKSPKLITIRDNSSDLKWLDFEKNVFEAIQYQLPKQDLKVLENTSVFDLKKNLSDCIWLSWSAHGKSSTKNWAKSWLQIGNSQVFADDIKDWNLPKRPVVMLAACETAVDGNADTGWDEYCGLDMAFRVAGAKTVVGSLWAVPDALAAITNCFLTPWVLSGTTTPDRGLTNMQAMLRTGRWKKFLLKPEQLKVLPKNLQNALESTQEPLWNLPTEAFAEAECWAAFRCHGRDYL